MILLIRYWKEALAVAAVIAVVIWYHAQISAAEQRGRAAERAEWVVKVETAKKAIEVSERAQTDLHRKLEIALANKQIVIRNNTKTNVQEVTRYVTVSADAKCDVPAGFVLHHNTAASGGAVDPGAPGPVVDTPSGVALSEVAATVADNYGTALEWRAELLDCRARYTSAWQMLEKLNRK